jgi:hypothetical protein
MKIKVYQSKEDTYVEMEVLAKYKYVGETDELSFINGKIYNCVGYDRGNNMARIVDETGEDYIYPLDNFILVEK